MKRVGLKSQQGNTWNTDPRRMSDLELAILPDSEHTNYLQGTPYPGKPPKENVQAKK